MFTLGYYVNADIIKEKLDHKGFFDLHEMSKIKELPERWEDFLNSEHIPDVVESEYLEKTICFNNGVLKASAKLSSYDAAAIASFLRSECIRNQISCTGETVFSHPSKIDLLTAAKANNFKTYFYFIATADPEINVIRVNNRVREGGHGVDREKIISRYHRAMNLAAEAFVKADRSFIIDNSYSEPHLYLEKNNEELWIRKSNLPRWIEKFILNKT